MESGRMWQQLLLENNYFEIEGQIYSGKSREQLLVQY